MLPCAGKITYYERSSLSSASNGIVIVNNYKNVYFTHAKKRKERGVGGIIKIFEKGVEEAHLWKSFWQQSSASN